MYRRYVGGRPGPAVVGGHGGAGSGGGAGRGGGAGGGARCGRSAVSAHVTGERRDRRGIINPALRVTDWPAGLPAEAGPARLLSPPSCCSHPRPPYPVRQHQSYKSYTKEPSSFPPSSLLSFAVPGRAFTPITTFTPILMTASHSAIPSRAEYCKARLGSSNYNIDL